MSFADVVKVQIFLRDIADAKVVSSIRDEILAESKPASTMVEVSGFVKWDALIEIDMIAAKSQK
jgi:2-iminobutanoate/2-iminopropanoate deaminase